MTSKTFLTAATLAAIAALGVAGCDRGGSSSSQGDGQTVGQKLDNALERTQQKLAAAGEKAQEKLAESTDRAAASVKNTISSTDTSGARNAMSDTAITASIKTDFLKDPDLSVLKIDVDTKDGVVTLNGLAENEAARQRAEKMAGAVKGVKEVRNYLAVKRT